MEETLNSTIDPACLQEPPLAMDMIKRKWHTLLHHQSPNQKEEDAYLLIWSTV